MAADKKKFIRNAQKQVQKGQLDRAITSYKAILKMDPKDVKVHNDLGDIYIRLNKKKEGITEYLWVADFYEKDGFYLRAIAICQKIVNLDPERFDVKLKMAELYSQQRLGVEAKTQYLQVADYLSKKGKVNEALEVYSKIADLDPTNLGVRVKLGKMYEKQSLPGKAASEYVSAAEGFLRERNNDKAIELLQKALALNPKSVTARRCLAQYHAALEEWVEVISQLEPLLSEEHVETELLLVYGDACIHDGRAPEAIRALEKAKDQDPSSKEVKDILGNAYLKGGSFDKGFELFAPIITDLLKDNQTDAAEILARRLTDANPQSDQAQQKMLEIAQRKGDKEEMSRIYCLLAEIYEVKGLPRNAIGVLEKALEVKPGNQEVTERIEALRSAGKESPAAVVAPPVETPPLEVEEPALEVEEAEALEVDVAEALAVADDEALEVDVTEALEVEEAEALEVDVTEALEVEEAEAVEVDVAEALEVADDEAVEVDVAEALEVEEAEAVEVGVAEALEVEEAEAVEVDVAEALEVADTETLEVADAEALEVDVAEALEVADAEALEVDVAEALEVADDEAVEVGVAEALEVADTETLEVADAEALEVADAETLEVAEDVDVEMLDLKGEELAEFAPEELAEEPLVEEEEEIEISLEGEEEFAAEISPELSVETPLEAFSEEFSPSEPPVETPIEKVPEIVDSAGEELVEEVDLEEGPLFSEEEATASVGGIDLEEEQESEALLAQAGFAPEEEGSLQIPAVPGMEESMEIDLEALQAMQEETSVEEVDVSGFDAGASSEEMEEFMAEADFYLQQGLLEEAEFLYHKLKQLAPQSQQIADRLLRLEAEKLKVPMASDPKAPPEESIPQEEISALESDLDRMLGDQKPPEDKGLKVSISEGQGEGKEEFSDFLSDLRDELDSEVSASMPAVQGEEDLHEMFQEFQAGLKEQLGEEDYETHYNLGIAYKEMGLMEEALGEFALAEKSASRKLDSLSMISLCLKDMGRAEEAIKKLEEGIEISEEGSEDHKGFLYDLADIHSAGGRQVEAQDLFTRLHAIDPDYRDVSKRLLPIDPKADAGKGEDKPAAPKKSRVSYL